MSYKGVLITALKKLFPPLIITTAKIFLLENSHYFTHGLPEHSPVQSEMSCGPSCSERLALSENCRVIGRLFCLFFTLHNLWGWKKLWLMALITVCLTTWKIFSLSSFKSYPCDASTHLWLRRVMLMACAWPPLFIHTAFILLSPDIAACLHVSTSLLSSRWRLWPGYYCCFRTRILPRTLRSPSELCWELLSINQISWWNGQGEVP